MMEKGYFVKVKFCFVGDKELHEIEFMDIMEYVGWIEEMGRSVQVVKEDWA